MVRRFFLSISTTSLLSVSFLLIPLLKAGKSGATPSNNSRYAISSVIRSDSASSILDKAFSEADFIYDSLHLQRVGLSKAALEYGLKGYERLLDEGMINRPDIITICDFSQSSRRKRMYLIDVKNYKLILNTYVAHGRNSGSEFANRFSNRPDSHQSSLGFYITTSTYYGEHGLALKLVGLEKGINDLADERNIVVHGSTYVGDRFLRNQKFCGRSFGCPAVPQNQISQVIQPIKNGTCFFIYHPTKKYLTGSKILNG